MATRLYTHRITVTGRGPFPIDMLRYDYAWPASERDAGFIYRTFDREGGVQYDVEVVTVRSGRQFMPFTVARWDSFGWSVNLDSHTFSESGL